MSITNKATVWNFEVMSDKFNLDEFYLNSFFVQFSLLLFQSRRAK